MTILTGSEEAAVRRELSRLGPHPVKLTVFSQELVAGDLCRQNEQLVRAVAGLSDRIAVEVLNPAIDRERAAAYGVDLVPAVAVAGARDYGIRFFGVPLGYEFTNLIDSILVASTGEPDLGEETKAALAGLETSVHIQVFSTPT